VNEVFSHARIDQLNSVTDRQIAQRLKHDSGLLKLARRNLKRWMGKEGRNIPPAFREWQRILELLSAAEIADFLCSQTPMARRLSQSSPFAGIQVRSCRTRRRPREKATA
jgi:hypothetical protein